MSPARKREPVVPRRVKAAIAYMLEQQPDLQAVAAHAGMTTAPCWFGSRGAV
jgi:hypothetical protein